MNFKIFNLDVFNGLKQIKSNSVDCIVTSPPYWGLRDYGVDGQLGLEKHPKEYIENLVKVFRETKKVLKDSGSLWLNLGDSYFGGKGKSSYETEGQLQERINSDKTLQKQPQTIKFDRPSDIAKIDGRWLQAKQKMLMPHRVAIAMQDDGWILRNDIVWHKPSHMPSPVRDRLTNSFEYLFHFVKQKKYYYDLDSIREPHTEGSIARAGRAVSNTHKYADQSNNPKNTRPNIKELAGKPMHGLHLWRKNNKELKDKGIGDISDYSFEGADYMVKDLNSKGKNPADMWSLTTEGFSEAHFACFPTKLVRKPLLATCPKEVCSKCNMARERILEPSPEYKKILESQRGTEYYKAAARKEAIRTGNAFGKRASRLNSNYQTKGWSNCGCGAVFNPGIVLDPFVGSGTTLLEAQNQGKSGIGIELNPEYISLIKLRLNGDRFQESLNPNKIEVIV